jgi:preprotein translocase subunit SecF
MLRSSLNVDFLGKAKLAYAISGTLLLISIISFAVNGIKFGIDFTGGSVFEIHYPQSVDLTKMRTSLSEQGLESTVQNFGSSEDVMIRLKPMEGVSQQELNQKILQAANSSQSQPGQLRRAEFIGPQVGDDLKYDGSLALFLSLIGVLIYVSVRFEWKLSTGAIASLIHDSTISVGFFSVFGWEFDMTALSAVMTIIGFSINDTIVIYDRIRESFRSGRKGTIPEITNAALNDTLSRTILTSFTVFLTILALFFWGGESIHGFATIMLIGVVVGSYSSIYVACALALALGLERHDLEILPKEAHLDHLP